MRWLCFCCMQANPVSMAVVNVAITAKNATPEHNALVLTVVSYACAMEAGQEMV